MWKMLKFMTQIPPMGKGTSAEARSQPAMQDKMIHQSLAYLEQRFESKKYIKKLYSCSQENIFEAYS